MSDVEPDFAVAWGAGTGFEIGRMRRGEACQYGFLDEVDGLKSGCQKELLRFNLTIVGRTGAGCSLPRASRRRAL